LFVLFEEYGSVVGEVGDGAFLLGAARVHLLEVGVGLEELLGGSAGEAEGEGAGFLG
jgi:hypothetical protein